MTSEENLRRPRGMREWLQYKYMQYNVTSCLYMLDWWERLLFNSIIISIFFATILAMYVYFQDSVPLFFLVMFLFGFTIFLIILCPLHQY
eukprot:CAMPEP_0174931524 /NCGR_PEP_ID=MMETSP1355-20121228/33985_1 /TAXON_ID=464990 /ORGANISM="Hemiselmis tepida, Strain CCMP443" /LENGTH=89 /DNA_ID=CAMNT_0016177885 /DNA_START=53 /DNA_END=322 /DNA_ORIENTATION=+